VHRKKGDCRDESAFDDNAGHDSVCIGQDNDRQDNDGQTTNKLTESGRNDKCDNSSNRQLPGSLRVGL